MNRKKIIFCKAVIFDMDGVITDTMRYHYQAWHQVFRNAGFHISREDVYKREGQKGITSIVGLCKDRGISVTPDRARRFLHQKERLFKKIFKKRFVQGSRRFVAGLKRRKFQLALVTGTSRREVAKILPQGLCRAFDVIVTGCDVHHGKPHPEPFRKALKQLKLISREAIVIENAPLGILSAKGAGLRCLALETSLPKSYLQKADGIFSSYKELNSKIHFVRK